jgi:hypothetical protein
MIDVLPDDVLLEIFSFYLAEGRSKTWHTLVHICRRWRSIVFASPRRLDLRILCTTGIRATLKEMLDIWPILPIEIRANGRALEQSRGEGADIIVAALEHSDRVCQISFEYLPSSLWDRIAAVTREPFPALTELYIFAADETATVFPEAFLGGSAPGLTSCVLYGIAIPRVRTLLLSAIHLNDLRLWDIPHFGYISPEVMITALSAMPNLRRFALGFRSPPSRLDQGRSRFSPLNRIVLPALTRFTFKGISEYIEDFVSRIDVTLLEVVSITLFNQLIFDPPLLHDFFSRTEIIKAHNRAAVLFYRSTIYFNLGSQFSLRVLCTALDWQLSSMAQVCSSSLPPFSTLERLDIQFREDPSLQPHELDDMENVQWLELLRPFTALKDLYLVGNLATLVAPALQEGGTDVLPALRNLFVEGVEPSTLTQGPIVQFVAARELSGRPIAVHKWDGLS